MATGELSDAQVFGPKELSDAEVFGASAPSPSGKPTSGEFILNSAKKGVGDFAAIPGMVLDFLRSSGSIDALEKAGKLPKPEDSRGWADLIRSGWDAMLGTNREMPAPGLGTRIAGKVVEMGVAGGPFSAKTIAQAPNTGRAVLAEISSAIGGGAGSELGGDIGAKYGGRAAGELIGGVAGGVAGLASPTAIDKGAAYLGPRFSQAGRERIVQQIADQRLRGALEAAPGTPANLQATERTAAEIERLGGAPFRPTIGQATGAPGVIDIERGVASKSPEDLGRYSARQDENRAAIEAAKNVAFPQTGAVTRGAANTFFKATRALDERMEALAQQQQSVAANVRGLPQQVVGEQLRGLRDQAQNIARASKNSKVDDLYATAERLGAKDTMGDVVSTIRSLGKSDENIYQTMPPVFGKILREHGKDASQLTGRAIPPDLMADAGIGVQKQASFREIHSLWRETNSELNAAVRSGDRNAAYYLEVLKNSLRDKLAKFEQGDYGELTGKFREFNKWFAEKYAPAFYEGVGGRMNARGRYGDIVKPEDVTAKFFTPSGIDDFNMIIAQLPNEAKAGANAALRDGVVGMFREKVVKDGVVDVTAAKNFLRANQETLAKVPDIQAALANPAKRAEAIAQYSARLNAGREELGRSTLARIVKTDDPDKLIQGALDNPKELQQLMAATRDNASRNAVRRGLVDGIPAAAERAGVDPLRFVLERERTLRGMLGQEHFDNLRAIASAETIVGRTTSPLHAKIDPTMGRTEQITGSSPRTIWAQTANTSAGRQSGTSAVLHLLSRFGIKRSEEMVTDVMREVIYNPDLARQLSQAARRPVTPAASNRLLEQLANAGIRAAATTQ